MQSNKDRIQAGKYFKVDQMGKLQSSALRLALQEMAVNPAFIDAAKITKLCNRFKIGRAFSFYSKNSEIYW